MKFSVILGKNSMDCSKYVFDDLQLGNPGYPEVTFGIFWITNCLHFYIWLLNCLKFFDFTMPKTRTGRPGTYPEKSIGIGSLDVKYSKYFRWNVCGICTYLVWTPLKMACLGKYCNVRCLVRELYQFSTDNCIYFLVNCCTGLVLTLCKSSADQRLIFIVQLLQKHHQ